MESSFYPFFMGLGVFVFVLGLIMLMKMGVGVILFYGGLYLVLVSFFWVNNVFYEGCSGQYTPQDSRMLVQGFRLFLFSELVLFFTIFWTFLDASLYPLAWASGGWSPKGVLSPDYVGVNALASSFLMINSHILKYSRRFLFLSDLKCEFNIFLCIGIGAGFVCFQVYEYMNNPFTITDSVYGSIFYLGTGLHGSHVFIGVLFLVINFFRLKLFHLNWFNSQAYDMSIDYWRFLEWMWGIMFSLVYIWGS